MSQENAYSANPGKQLVRTVDGVDYLRIPVKTHLITKEDDMAEYLRTTPGSVSALELLFDTGGHVQLVIDRDLMADAFISGHPGISTSTLRLKREDLLRYVASTGHEPVYIDLPDPRAEE